MSWTAPSSPSTPIISYLVIASPGGVTQPVNSDSTTTTMTGLTNGQNYTFTVTAANSIGTSAPSSPSNRVTIGLPPAAPTRVRATAGDAQAAINWAAPTSPSGLPITSYTVVASPGNQVQRTTDDSTAITMTGLTNGQKYTFTVTATNVAGTSPPSSSSGRVTVGVPPGAPTAVQATPGDAQATISWTAPTTPSGLPIISYTVVALPERPIEGTSADATRTTSAGDATTTTITGLTRGQAYTFIVTATNAAGTGEPSSPSNRIVVADHPVAPPTP
jgi:hypothetical protein